MKCDIFAETPYICFSLFIILTINKNIVQIPNRCSINPYITNYENGARKFEPSGVVS